MSNRKVIWWGRSDTQYSRNAIIRKHFHHAGWTIIDFSPRFSFGAALEATLRNFKDIDLVWVPCFRQRDLDSAAKWSTSRNIPLVFDPLISAYDKQVFERKKFAENSDKAKKLLRWETQLFHKADLIITDTQAHATYFAEQFGVKKDKFHVILVSADEKLFMQSEQTASNDELEKKPLDVLFYGSYVPLQGPDIIIQSAAQYQGPEVNWTLLGDGSLRKDCEKLASTLGTSTVHFEDWVDYQKLPKRIQAADIILGIFGDTPKASRVIPNKVFQSMAMGKPVITQQSAAYPKEVQRCQGLSWVTAGNPTELANAVYQWAKLTPKQRQELGKSAYKTFKEHLSSEVSSTQFAEALRKINLS